MKPVVVELTDFKTKEKVDELEVDAVLVATGRAPYTQVLPPWPAVQSWKPYYGLGQSVKSQAHILRAEFERQQIWEPVRCGMHSLAWTVGSRPVC